MFSAERLRVSPSQLLKIATGAGKRPHVFGIFSGKVKTFHLEVNKLEGMRNDWNVLFRLEYCIYLPFLLRWLPSVSVPPTARLPSPMSKWTPHVDLNKKFQLDTIFFWEWSCKRSFIQIKNQPQKTLLPRMWKRWRKPKQTYPAFHSGDSEMFCCQHYWNKHVIT